MFSSYKKTISVAVVAAGMLMASAAADALTFNGGEFTVTGTLIDNNTATFVYTADFTNWTNVDYKYIFAVDLGISAPKVLSIDSFSTTASGGWTAGTGASTANGCTGGSNVFACAMDGSFDPATGQGTTGIVTWTFEITFNGDLTSANWTDSDNHIGAFFNTCSVQGGRGPNAGSTVCKGGLGLSEETTFGDDSGGDDGDDSGGDDVPEPGSLGLLGLSLIGLGMVRRRRAA